MDLWFAYRGNVFLRWNKKLRWEINKQYGEKGKKVQVDIDMQDTYDRTWQNGGDCHRITHLGENISGR
jgi:hypothetical protein